jgi:hypothetical protein
MITTTGVLSRRSMLPPPRRFRSPWRGATPFFPIPIPWFQFRGVSRKRRVAASRHNAEQAADGAFLESAARERSCPVQDDMWRAIALN